MKINNVPYVNPIQTGSSVHTLFKICRCVCTNFVCIFVQIIVRTSPMPPPSWPAYSLRPNLGWEGGCLCHCGKCPIPIFTLPPPHQQTVTASAGECSGRCLDIVSAQNVVGVGRSFLSVDVKRTFGKSEQRNRSSFEGLNYT